MASDGNEDFMKHAMKVLEFGMKLKKRMIALGKRRVRVQCPDCPKGTHIWGTLHGRRDHLHMKCEGCGNYTMME